MQNSKKTFVKFKVIALLVFLLPLATLNSAYSRSTPESFADLSEKLLPAVVNISTTQIIKGQQAPNLQFPPGSPFKEFFEDFMNRGGPSQREARSLGSGFIVSPDGLVVTNNHVIADADKVTVVLHNDIKLEAKILGRDPQTDLALLKVKHNKDLPYLKWGNSDTLRVGDWVLAIGNPFGLGGTVTAGIVSARARMIGAGKYDNFIQTDASINRGNSGGPMFNLEGEVVGINTAIVSPSGGSVGIGFAIPSTMAKNVIEQIKEFGEIRRGWLGVTIQHVSEEIAESLGLKDNKGALVAGVTEDSPAEKAGLKTGDVIVEYDGEVVPEMRRFPLMVAKTKIGETVKIKVWRDGELKTVTAKIEKLEENNTQLSQNTNPVLENKNGTLGLQLSKITPAMREKFSLSDNQKGVLIVGVKQDSNAAKKGLQQGDVIKEVSREQVVSPTQVRNKIESAKKKGKKSVLFLIDREGNSRFIALKIDES